MSVDFYGSRPFFTPNPFDNRHGYWGIYAWKDDFNDANLDLPLSLCPAEIRDGTLRLGIVKRVYIGLVGAAPGIRVGDFAFPSSYQSNTIPVPTNWTTTATYDAHSWEIEIPFTYADLIKIPSAGMCRVHLANYGANDDIEMLITGEMWRESNTDQTALAPTPVSLERLKWPLPRFK